MPESGVIAWLRSRLRGTGVDVASAGEYGPIPSLQDGTYQSVDEARRGESGAMPDIHPDALSSDYERVHVFDPVRRTVTGVEGRTPPPTPYWMPPPDPRSPAGSEYSNVGLVLRDPQSSGGQPSNDAPGYDYVDLTQPAGYDHVNLLAGASGRSAEAEIRGGAAGVRAEGTGFQSPARHDAESDAGEPDGGSGVGPSESPDGDESDAQAWEGPAAGEAEEEVGEPAEGEP